MSVHDIADWFGIISGTITILGIGGTLSWAFTSKSKNRFAEAVASISAYSLKFAFVCLIFLMFEAIWHLVIIALIATIGDGSLPSPRAYWDASQPVVSAASIAISSTLIAPLFLIVAACLLTFSLTPISSVIGRLRDKDRPHEAEPPSPLT